MIILMAGLPGTGKSTLARVLADDTSGILLSKDQIRDGLFGPNDIEYSAAQDDFCMEIMLQAAHFLLLRNPQRAIYLDGRTFSKRYQIDRVLAFAGQISQPWAILECRCSELSALRRIESDLEHPASNRNVSLYREVRERFEPIEYRKAVIDTDQPLEVCIRQARVHLA